MKVLSVVGARPQFVKCSVLSRLFLHDPDFDEVLVHTGQHYSDNMSAVFFEQLDIPPPAHNLSVSGGGHGAMTGKMMQALEPVVMDEAPDAVLVYGDTNSTLAGALVAAKLHIPVVHVEAGLRSFNRRMPEELNRIATDHLSSILFCSTETSRENLANEGIREGVHVVGDIMYDAALAAMDRSRDITTVAGIDLDAGDIALCTLHRAENTDDPDRLRRLFDLISEQGADKQVIFPMHPRTARKAGEFGIPLPRATIIDPVSYLDLFAILTRAKLVLTDSGGLQKEAYFARVPCVTMREETEWVETVSAGWNRLWTHPEYVSPRTEITDYGTGTSGQKMMDLIRVHLGKGV